MRALCVHLCSLGLMVTTTVALLAAPTPKPAPKSKDVPSIEHIRKMLDAKVNLEFANTNLGAVLAQLSDENHINFVLDKAVLQQMGFDANDLMVDVKLKEVKFRNGLVTMLSQFNLTYAVVNDMVLVTSEEQAVYKLLKQRISVDYEEAPLAKALKELAKANGVNIVIDPHVIRNKAADAAISLTVEDVPFEAVVRIMCEMANLKPARMGNVIYVTTEDRAEKLKDSNNLVPTPGPVGPLGLPNAAVPFNVPPAVVEAPAPPRIVEKN